MIKVLNGRIVNCPDDYLKKDGSVNLAGRLQMDTMSINGNDSSHGISWYTPTYTTWFDYMLNGGGKACNGVKALPYGDVTSWAIRHNVETTGGMGWIWEGSPIDDVTNAPIPVMALESRYGNLKLRGTIEVNTLKSIVASGTPPLSVTSPTKVSNLNSDMVDGLHGDNLTEFYPNISKALFQNTNNSKAYTGSFRTDGTTWGTPNDSAEQYYQIIYIPNAVTGGGYGTQILYCFYGVNAGKTFQRFSTATTWNPWTLIALSQSIDLTMVNGWTNYGSGFETLRAVKVGNLVTLHGVIKSGTLGSIISTLPAGWRPTNTCIGIVMTDSNNTIGRIDINTDGTIVATTVTSNWVTLNGVSFYVP